MAILIFGPGQILILKRGHLVQMCSWSTSIFPYLLYLASLRSSKIKGLSSFLLFWEIIISQIFQDPSRALRLAELHEWLSFPILPLSSCPPVAYNHSCLHTHITLHSAAAS